MSREIRFQFVFKHAESKETIISTDYTLDQLFDTHLEEIQEKACDCDCQPTGESSFKECNCLDYYVEFELIAKRQFTGLKDKNGVEIYEGDIVQTVDNELSPGKYVIHWREDVYMMVGTGGPGEWLSMEEFEGCELIGNIHQNPELLKGDQQNK